MTDAERLRLVSELSFWLDLGQRTFVRETRARAKVYRYIVFWFYYQVRKEDENSKRVVDLMLASRKYKPLSVADRIRLDYWDKWFQEESTWKLSYS